MKRLLLILLAAAPLAAAEPPTVSTTTAAAPWDPFVEEAARRLEVPPEKILELRRYGFGKTESLIFISVSKASKKPWADLLKERESGVRLRKMSEEAGLDHDAEFEKASALKKRIDAAALSPRSETGTLKP